MHKGPNAITRREFIKYSAGIGLSFAIIRPPLPGAEGEPLPRRVLGRTGREVTILGLGTAPIGEGPVNTDEAERIFSAVIDRGVNYVDTARIYGNAEEALGRIIPQRRDDLFLVTKIWAESAKDAEKSLEESLRRLKTDHVDLVHIHHIGGKNVERVQAEDGILPYLIGQKEAGKLKFIGMTGHARPPRFLDMLKTGKIDVVMCVMNYADRNTYGFENSVLPECRKQNVGVVAMKVYAGIRGGFPNHRSGYVGCATPDELLPQAMAYALDLDGVSSAIIGPYTMEQALQNITFASQYRPLPPEQRAELLAFGAKLAEKLGTRYGPVA
jgi:predicted aldo/keto reductase-like oxidoreductase